MENRNTKGNTVQIENIFKETQIQKTPARTIVQIKETIKGNENCKKWKAVANR